MTTEIARASQLFHQTLNNELEHARITCDLPTFLPGLGLVASLSLYSKEDYKGPNATVVLLGIGLAILLSYSRMAREALYPNLVFFQLIPKIALAPLFIIWLGIGSESRLAFAVFSFLANWFEGFFSLIR